MTYAQEMKLKHPDRWLIARPTWELRNMVRALQMLAWNNTADDNARLEEAKRELRLRTVKR